MNLSVAIVDIMGIPYDGTTLKKRGLGGSESAVILMSKELTKLGFSVTVFNNCVDDAKPGIYDGVSYRNVKDIPDNEKFDIVISSRTVFPFVPKQMQNMINFDASAFSFMRTHAKLKIVWMHDTFCAGDHILENLVVNGFIDELFTLSDFHTSYVTTCNHGVKRMFEVLKDHIFMTRNGIVRYSNQVDISKKDPDLFVYNASTSKGMVPLVEDIWENIKRNIPGARLKIIGGYYKFAEASEPDEQEKKWRSLATNQKYKDLGVEFTGIIKQSEIAEILSEATFMIYPPAFPETFGISTLESLAYNTPLISSRFGALEETAVAQACYMMDYPIEPNNVYPTINAKEQQNNFINLALSAHRNKYLLQQKQHYCNIIKDISGWDSVAKQWKQHLIQKLGLYLHVDEYREVSSINSRVHTVFGRRFHNKEEFYIPRNPQQRILIITPVYNAEKYIERCIASVVTQDYDNYLMVIIDDNSSDATIAAAENIINASGKADKFKIHANKENLGAVCNQISALVTYGHTDDIVMLLDGDDSLMPSNQIFQFYNNLYDGTTEFSYGSCWSEIDNIPLIAQEYPDQVKRDKSYRKHLFNWNMPYTHLRTFKGHLLNGLNESDFKDGDGNWYKAGGDGAVFYSLIENADPDKIKVVTDIVYRYNDASPINDYKVNGKIQTQNAQDILKRSKAKEQFSVIVPTMWRCPNIFAQSLSSIVDLDLVGEIIIIDNDFSARPAWNVLAHPKIKILTQEKNIKVNPSWNLGVETSKNNMLCIVNDDIMFDSDIFSKIHPHITPNNGVYGIVSGESKFNHPQYVDGGISFKRWKHGDNIHSFGQLMFMHKSNWTPIIPELEIYFGDDYIFHTQLMKSLPNYLIFNIDFYSTMAATSKDPLITEGVYAVEQPIWATWFFNNPLPK